MHRVVGETGPARSAGRRLTALAWSVGPGRSCPDLRAAVVPALRERLHVDVVDHLGVAARRAIGHGAGVLLAVAGAMDDRPRLGLVLRNVGRAGDACPG